MTRSGRTFTGSVVLAVLAMGWAPGSAKSEAWKDSEGNRFRGEPAEVIGPFALFSTSSTSGRRVPLHLLAPADCVRFWEQVRTKPARASDWAEAGGAVSRELLGRVLRVANGRLIPADLKGRPEPECFILFFASHGEGKSWEMMGNAAAGYARMQQEYPGMVEAVFYGVRHTRADQADMAVNMNLAWLVADASEESRMNRISWFVPADGYGVVIVNRDGVPLFSSGGENEAVVRKLMDELALLLQLMSPGNPASWKDRLHYFRATQPAAYANGQCDPLLIGDPLRPDALKQRGVFRFEAVIHVAAAGAVSDAAVKPGGEMPAELEAPIGEALRQAVFVPAVRNGQWVDGTYLYHCEVPR